MITAMNLNYVSHIMITAMNLNHGVCKIYSSEVPAKILEELTSQFLQRHYINIARGLSKESYKGHLSQNS
jgi:hypothetical protein